MRDSLIVDGLLLTGPSNGACMKRFRVHAHVTDLAASIAFHSKRFASEPARIEADYAKSMMLSRRP